MNRFKCAIIVTVLSFSGVLASCVTLPLNPDYLDAEFSPADVDELIVLPIADLRVDKSVEADVQKSMTDALSDFLPIMGYEKVVYADTFGKVSSISEDDIEQGRVDWIQSLGPDRTRWVLLVALHDLATRLTYGSASVAECSGYLYDKAKGKTVWHQKAVGEFGYGALFGLSIAMLGKTLANNGAWVCAIELLTQLPTKNEKKWRRHLFNKDQKILW